MRKVIVHRAVNHSVRPVNAPCQTLGETGDSARKHEGPREGDPRASCCGDSETRRSFATQ